MKVWTYHEEQRPESDGSAVWYAITKDGSCLFYAFDESWAKHVVSLLNQNGS